ncbi:MAG: COX15/CtaA family protein [Pricia sp.]
MQERFRSIAKISLVLVYLVIAAGATVRMTGSGMGCPDWPKCFGYYIPPTEASELQWQADREYESGQVIIRDESLKVAKEDFKTSSEYSDENWAPYTKHDYAIFNPWHTWIEFINRLMGALAGLATLVLAVFSLKFWKKKKVVTILAWAVVFGMGFQAWLGATVVYSVLEPLKITLHMMMALVIVALLLYLIHATKKVTSHQSTDRLAGQNRKATKPACLNQETAEPIGPESSTTRPTTTDDDSTEPVSSDHKYRKNLLGLIGFALAATLIQIVLGTQVRQFVDERIDVVGEAAKGLWLENAEWEFYAHRSFSIIVVLLNLFVAQLIYKRKLGFSKINWVLLLLFIEAASGISMYYLDFPFATQPIHLIIASILFGVQFYLVLEALRAKKTQYSS